MAKEIVIDPEFKALIPPPEPEEKLALEQSILRDGCRDPLVIWKGILVDGHNRHEICKKLGKPFRTTELQRIDTREGVMLWMIDNQLARRNVPDYQRGALALKKKELIAERGSQGARSDLLTKLSKGAESNTKPAHNTRKEIAAIAGLSEGTIAKIEQVQNNAAEPIIAAVRNKEITINAASKLAALPADQQEKITAGGKEAIRAAAKQIVKCKAPAKPNTRPKPNATPAKAPAATPADTIDTADGDELEALRAENADLKRQIGELANQFKQTLDDNQMMAQVFQADQPLAAAMAEIKRLTDLYRNLEIRCNGTTIAKSDVIQCYEGTQRNLSGLEKKQMLPNVEQATCSIQSEEVQASAAHGASEFPRMETASDAV